MHIPLHAALHTDSFLHKILRVFVNIHICTQVHKVCISLKIFVLINVFHGSEQIKVNIQ